MVIKLLKYNGAFVIQKKSDMISKNDILKMNNEILFYENVSQHFNETNIKYLVKYCGCIGGLVLEYHQKNISNITDSIDMISSIHNQFWGMSKFMMKIGLHFGHIELINKNNLADIYSKFIKTVKLTEDQLSICNEIIGHYNDGYYDIKSVLNDCENYTINYDMSSDVTLSHGEYCNSNILQGKIIDWKYVNINRCTDDLIMLLFDNYDMNNIETSRYMIEYYYFRIQYSRIKFENDLKKSVLIPFIFSLTSGSHLKFFNFYKYLIGCTQP